MRSDKRKALAELHTAADTHRATFNAAGIPGYFIAADAWGDTWIWRERGSAPVPVIGRSTFDTAPDLWAAIVTLVGGGSR